MIATLTPRASHAACLTSLHGRQRRRRVAAAIAPHCIAEAGPSSQQQAASSSNAPETSLRRELLARAAFGTFALAAGGSVEVQPAEAIGFQKDLTNKRRQKIDPSEFKDGPEGLKYYDVVVGTGPEAVEGKRVVVHFDCKWKGVTFITTRQSMGVTGGTPQGFDVGAKVGAGGTLKGLDLGVRGMRVGGRRKLIVPPSLAYGDKGVGEIPPGATLDFDVELLSIKQDSVGFRVKVVEG